MGALGLEPRGRVRVRSVVSIKAETVECAGPRLRNMPAKIAALVGPKLAGDRFLMGAMILRFQKYLYFLAVRAQTRK